MKSLVERWIEAGIFGNGPAKLPEGQVTGANVSVFAAQIVHQAMPLIGDPMTSGIGIAQPLFVPGRANIVGAPMPKNNLKVIRPQNGKS